VTAFSGRTDRWIAAWTATMLLMLLILSLAWFALWSE